MHTKIFWCQRVNRDCMTSHRIQSNGRVDLNTSELLIQIIKFEPWDISKSINQCFHDSSKLGSLNLLISQSNSRSIILKIVQFCTFIAIIQQRWLAISTSVNACQRKPRQKLQFLHNWKFEVNVSNVSTLYSSFFNKLARILMARRKNWMCFNVKLWGWTYYLLLHTAYFRIIEQLKLDVF